MGHNPFVFHGLATHEASGEVVAVITNLNLPSLVRLDDGDNQENFMLDQDALQDLLQSADLQEGASETYLRALAAIDDYRGAQGPELQTISEVDDYVLPDGDRLGDRDIHETACRDAMADVMGAEKAATTDVCESSGNEVRAGFLLTPFK